MSAELPPTRADDGADAVLAMFPLGSVLLPGMVLPLHVFEDRYRQMVDDVLAAGEPEFGVVLIERGSEVGGGDLRSMSGCLARVVEAARTPDGRWAVVAVGTGRLRVRWWLPDDPYPRAVVEPWPDPQPEDPASLDAVLAHLEPRVRRLAALASELGAPGLPDDLELSADPVQRTYQLAVLSPLGALDRQRVLDAADPLGRVRLLAELIDEQQELLEARLALGDDGPFGAGHPLDDGPDDD
jgi:uncharacterized protein